MLAHEGDEFLDNLPDTANMVLNILWDENREMRLSEITDAVNKKYGTNWKDADIKQFLNLLIRAMYAEKKVRGFRTYYVYYGGLINPEDWE